MIRCSVSQQRPFLAAVALVVTRPAHTAGAERRLNRGSAENDQADDTTRPLRGDSSVEMCFKKKAVGIFTRSVGIIA